MNVIDNGIVGETVRCDKCGRYNNIGTTCSCLTEDCPGRSQGRCEYCGNCHSVFAVCNMNPDYSDGIINEPKKYHTDLNKLYDELGSMKWIGMDSSWDMAIDAVRKEIVKRIR